MIRKDIIIFLLFLLFLLKMNETTLSSPAYYNNPSNPSEHWITYIAGDGPVVLVASHDGSLTPGNIQDREDGCLGPTSAPTPSQYCVWDYTCPSGFVTSSSKCDAAISQDPHSSDIAQCLQDVGGLYVNNHLFQYHYIKNNLARIKLDTNRERDNGGCNTGNTNCQAAWDAFHGYVDDAVNAAIAACDFALVIDIHGHNRCNYTMLGYYINEDQFSTSSDSNLNDETLSSIEGVKERNNPPYTTSTTTIASIVRGDYSLGTFLNTQRLDWKMTPSTLYPNPAIITYYDSTKRYMKGDYVVKTYGSGYESNAYSSKSDAIQIETPNWLRTQMNINADDYEWEYFCTGLDYSIYQWIAQWHSTRYGNCHV